MSTKSIDNLNFKASQGIGSLPCTLANKTNSSKSRSLSFDKQTNQAPLLVNNHPMLTKAKIEKCKPKASQFHFEPTTAKQALA